MRFWKWGVWPRKCRTVRQTQNPLPDDNSFHPPDEELQQRAEHLAKRAMQLLAEITPESAGVSAGVTYKAIASTQDFMQSQSCYAELARRQDIRRADRETKEALERSERDRTREIHHFWIELIVIGLLIVGEIGLSLYFGLRGLAEGRQQAAILNKVNENTTATAVQIQRAADAMTASLRILQQEQAERAKKPKLALYVGNTLLDKAAVHLTARKGQVQAMASLDLLLKNEGDAPVSTFRVHALVPAEIVFETARLITVLEPDPPANAKIHTVTVQLAPLPAGQMVRIHVLMFVPNGHSPFKIPFTVDALELQTVAPVGSLTVLPPKP